MAILILSLVACDAPTPPPPAVPDWAAYAFGADDVVWAVTDSASESWMTPLIDGPRVYFQRGNELIARASTTGQLMWSNSIVAAQNATVVGERVGAVWGALEVFDRTTGSRSLRYTYPGQSLGSNVVGDDARFYVATFHGHVVAVNALTGTAEWDADLSGSHPSVVGFGVTLSGPRLIATLKYFRSSGLGSDSGIVASLDRTSGTVHWRTTLDPTTVNESAIVLPAVVSGDNVIVQTQGHDIVALSLVSGAPRWRADVAYGQPTNGSDGLALCTGRVVTSTGDFGLSALDPSTGALLWHASDIGQGSLMGIECSYGTILAGSLTLFDPMTGVRRSTYPRHEVPGVPGFWIARVTRDSAYLYVATTRGFAKIQAP